jgi:lipopolysaccharide assembly protein A
MSRIIRLLFILLVLLAGIAFHLRNDDLVTLDFYSGSASLPFSVWLLLALTTGVVLGLLACLPALVGARVQIGRLRRRAQALEPAAPATGKPEGGG